MILITLSKKKILILIHSLHGGFFDVCASHIDTLYGSLCATADLTFLRHLVSHRCTQFKIVAHFRGTGQMPSLKMKAKLNADCLRQKTGLHVCQKSSIISKHSCSHIRISPQTDEFESCLQSCQDGKEQKKISVEEIFLCRVVD